MSIFSDFSDFAVYILFHCCVLILQSTCLVLITIQDLNDNSPILGQMSYAVNVIENTGPGIVINVVRKRGKHFVNLHCSGA